MGETAMVGDDKTGTTAPYSSFQTFLSLLDRLNRDGVPQHIDRHYWGGFLGGAVGQQMMATLRFLGLISPLNNEPTPALNRLVAPDERKAALGELLRERYAAIWDAGVDPSRTTPGHIEAAISKAYKVEGETRRKATTFFVHAAKYAEMPLSSQIAAKTRQRRATSSANGRSRSKTGRQSGGIPPADAGKTTPPREGAEHPPQGNGPYASLHSWLGHLPKDNRWTASRRTKWLAAFQAHLDFLIDVEDEEIDEGYFDDDGEE